MLCQLYILYDSYQPTTAGTNHLLAYVKGLAKQNVKCKIFYLYPDEKNSILSSEENIEQIYLWKRQSIFRDKYLCSLISLFIFIRQMRKDVPVYVVGTSVFLPLICGKKGYSIYHERTEHPKVSGTISGILGKLLFNAYLKSLKKLKGLFVISNNLRHCFIDDYDMDPNKVHVINMVVDADRFAGLQKQSTERYIAYCGTASNNKDGVDQLIKSFAIISKTHPDVKLWIIGKTPDKKQCFANKKLVDDLGITDKVLFTGVISAEEMPQILTNAEILVLNRPNNLQAKFGFPTKLGEYLLTGNPVVVTKVGDIPFFLEDGVSAMISVPDNPKAFSEKTIWLLTHPKDGKIIGERGKEVAMREFNYLIESNKLKQIIFSK